MQPDNGLLLPSADAYNFAAAAGVGYSVLSLTSLGDLRVRIS
jgi:hypothetical protein